MELNKWTYNDVFSLEEAKKSIENKENLIMLIEVREFDFGNGYYVVYVDGDDDGLFLFNNYDHENIPCKYVHAFMIIEKGE